MNEFQTVVFLLENKEYGIEIQKVQEIIRLLKITRVPHAPHFVSGVVNLRGNVLPVMDLRLRFGFPPGPVTDDTRIIITKSENKLMGLIVDNVVEVIGMDNSWLEPPPVVTENIKTEFLQGVARIDQRLIIMLNLKKVNNLEFASSL